MTTLDELVIRIKADASQLERELKKIGAASQQTAAQTQSAFAKVERQLKGMIPAVSLAALVVFTKHSVAAGDALHDMSVRTGVTVETLSKLSLAAKQSGTSIEAIGNGFRLMSRNLAEASQRGGD